MSKPAGRLKSFDESRFAGTNIRRTDYLRVAEIIVVRTDGDRAGTVDVRFLDSPEIRKYLYVTQSNSDSYNMPTIGDTAVVGFDMHESPYILGYIPTGIRDYLTEDPDTGGRAIRAVKAGERYWRGPNGQEVYMDTAGNLILDDGRGGNIKLSASDGTATIENINFSLKTEAGLMQFGVARREYINPVTQELIEVPYTIDGIPISDISDSVATEFSLKIVPYADNDLTTDANINRPLAEIHMGFSLSDLGIPNSPWQMELKVNDSNGDQKSAVKLGNNGVVNVEGDIINIGAGAVNGAVLSEPLIAILKNIIDLYNGHEHAVAGNVAAPTQAVVMNDLDVVKSSKTMVE